MAATQTIFSHTTIVPSCFNEPVNACGMDFCLSGRNWHNRAQERRSRTDRKRCVTAPASSQSPQNAVRREYHRRRSVEYLHHRRRYIWWHLWTERVVAAIVNSGSCKTLKRPGGLSSIDRPLLHRVRWLRARERRQIVRKFLGPQAPSIFCFEACQTRGQDKQPTIGGLRRSISTGKRTRPQP